MTAKTNLTPKPFLERIEGLDVLRGIALLGILLANVHQMFLPLSFANSPVDVVPGEAGTWWEWSFFQTFIDLKFLTIFSLLFGIGFALQFDRSSLDPAKFRKVYLRRLLALGFFGVLHGLFLYSLEVLLLYAIGGFLLFWCRNWPAKRLMLIGLWLTLVTFMEDFSMNTLSDLAILNFVPALVLAGLGFWLIRKQSYKVIFATGSLMLVFFLGGLAVLGSVPENNTRELGYIQIGAAEVAKTDVDQVAIGGKTYDLPLTHQEFALISEGEPSNLDQARIEYIANKYGPFWLLFDIHKKTFISLQFYIGFYLLWKTLGIFMIGAGLVKMGILSKENKPLWKKTAVWGIGLGLPFSALAAYMSSQAFFKPDLVFAFGKILHSVSALPLAFGLAGLIMVWSQTKSKNFLQKGFASAGRMALTNYIGQSAVMAFLASWYGFGLYGSLSHFEQFGLALLVFAGLMVFSKLWLNFFRMGPLEWFWRCITYWRVFPLKVKKSKA